MKAMTRISLALLTAFALTLSGAARAQETFESLGGGIRVFALGHRERGDVHRGPALGERHRLVEEAAPPVHVRGVEDARGQLGRGERG